jgi:tRNA A-37 threonylcarbamoyl transferase component Bud32
MFIKHIDSRIAEDEVHLHSVAAELGLAPKIHDVVKESDIWIVAMDDLDSLNTLSNIYGDDSNKIPDWIWDEIRYILNTLLDSGIEYVDITSYNFMEVESKIYIIDFGDAKYRRKGGPMNWFLKEFIDGYNGWNPDFR